MSTNTDAPIRERVRREMEANDPPIEVGAVWSGKDAEGKPLRRIRILAAYPPDDKYSEKYWIYENLPGGKLRLQIGLMGRIPEFNLRYFAEPEEGS
jgi:hypothetical protein